MNRQKVFIVLVIAIVGVTIINFLNVGEASEEYMARIEEERKTKNGFMLSGGSPIPKEERNSFTGLNFFPINEEFKVLAKVTPVSRKQPVFIPTTTGESKKYIPYAYAEFELKGSNHRVLLYQDWEENNPNRLSLMFADETSGDATYGGGRYIDVMKSNGNSIIIDFNSAYNPYCHFNEEWSCPIPPRENLLEVAIEAGERIYKDI